jgi:hypothetical protein
MSLELTPTLEREVQELAQSEGMTANDFIGRLIAQIKHLPNTNQQPNQEETEQEKRFAEAKARMQAWQKEYGLPVPPSGFKTTTELFAQWREEDANMTEEEQQAERDFWEDFHAKHERISI